MVVEVETSKDDYYVGQDIEVNVKISNTTGTNKSCILSLKAKLVRYTGDPVTDVNTKDDPQRKIRVLANESKIFIHAFLYFFKNCCSKNARFLFFN